MKHRAAAIALAFILGWPGPIASTPASAAQTADFSSYRTYAWAPRRPAPDIAAQTHERVRASIDRTLAERGYRQGEPGDFIVAFSIGHRDKVDLAIAMESAGWGGSRSYGGPPPASDDSVTEGTLTIDIFDGASRQLVWRGEAADEVTPGMVGQKQIDRIVQRAFKRVPKAPR